MDERIGAQYFTVREYTKTIEDFEGGWENWKIPQMCEVGRGNLDRDGIIAACEDAGVHWAFVEQDTNHIDDDPFWAFAVSYDYLKTKGFC